MSLGRAVIRDRFKGRSALHERGGGMSVNHTSDLDDGSLHSRITDSITEQSNLEDFLSTAALAGTVFAAEKMNVSMFTEFNNEAIMTGATKQKLVGTHREKQNELRVPRRPRWTRSMPADVLEQLERESFLEWRRGLARLQEDEGLLLTPFERNIELWRQLWRVVERSDVVVQIVDARNPLMFRCPDLERYVTEVNPKKQNVLLLNKADLLPFELRKQWAEYFDKLGVSVVFFSAVTEQIRLVPGYVPNHMDEYEPPSSAAESVRPPSQPFRNLRVEEAEASLGDAPSLTAAAAAAAAAPVPAAAAAAATSAPAVDSKATEEAEAAGAAAAAEDTDTPTPLPAAATVAAAKASASRPKNNPELVLCDELLDLLRARCGEGHTIGLVGYPNVGKSSTINALCHSKKVSVSATPGKTKHFQTIELGDTMLCDCPGLVFPNFVCTRAEMVCNGILPIDQMRDAIAPVTHVCLTIPRATLESIYSIKIIAPSMEDPDPNRPPTARELLNAYSAMRGFMASRGLPDVSRGARYILKDFVNGKLLHCELPPQELTAAAVSHAEQLAQAIAEADRRDRDGGAPRGKSEYANEVDDDFFSAKGPQVMTRGNQTKKASGKKHFNKHKREKLRRIFPTA